MKKRNLIAFLLVIVICFGFSGCFEDNSDSSAAERTSVTESVSSKDNTAVVSVDEPTYEKGTTTLCIYMCGNDLETKSGKATKNISELLSADIPDNTTVLIQTGGTKKWKNDDIPSDKISRYIIKDKKLTLLDTLPQTSMGNSQTLSDFLLWAAKNYLAENNDLILWGHGGGTLGGVCYDEWFKDDSLKPKELNEAFSNIYDYTKRKFDFVGFDACMMSTYETAAAAAPFTKNMIASEERESGSGWNYKNLAENLNTENFYKTVLNDYAQKNTKKDYYTLTHINTEKFGIITKAFNELLEKLKSSEPREVISSVNESLSFGSNQDDLYDLGNILEYFGIDCDFSEVMEVVNGEVKSSATGLSIYFPLDNEKNIEKYKSVCDNSEYADFLTEFYKNSDNDSISFKNYARIENNSLSYTITEKSLKYFSDGEYILSGIAENSTDESLMVYGTDNNCSVFDTQIGINFAGKWFSFNGHFLYSKLIDKTDDYNFYVSNIKVNDREACLYLTYNTITKEIYEPLVSYPDENNCKYYHIKSGDKITVEKYYVKDSESYTHFYDENMSFEFSEKTSIKLEMLPDGQYMLTAFANDIYGNRYTAGTAAISVEKGKFKIIFITEKELVYPDE